MSLFRQKKNFKNGLASELAKVKSMLASISIIFFLFALSYDSVHYAMDKQWILFAINFPVVVFLLVILFVKIKSESNQKLTYAISYAFAALCIVISNWYYAFHTEYIEVHTFRILIVSCFVLIGARFLLKPLWSHIFLIFFLLNYGLICLYAKSDGMNAHFLIIAFIFFVLDYWIRTYSRLSNMAFKEALNNQREISLLNEVVDLDKQQIRDALVNLAEKSEEAGVDLTSDIEVISCVVDSGVSVNSGRTRGATSDKEHFEERIMEAHPDLTPIEVDLAYVYLGNGRSEDIADAMNCTLEEARELRKDLRAKLSPSGGLRRYLLIFDSDDDV